MLLTPYHAKFFAYDILRKTRSDISATVFNAKVQMNPHQVLAAQYAIRSPIAKGAILADEVGLGKTIEAGLILAQMWAERKRKLIIVCPAVLRKQWQEELKDKFALDSIILDSKPIIQAKKDGIDLFNLSEPNILICSYNLINREEYNLKLKSIPFDLVVFDEAHKLKNEKSKVYQSIQEAFSHTKKILLTATPLQNNLNELYGLVNIIDNKFFASKRALNSNLSDLELSHLRERLKSVCHRSLRKDVASFIRYTERHSQTFNYQSTNFELQLFQELNDFIFDELVNVYDVRVIHLIKVALLKIKSSSSIAIFDTLQKIRLRVEQSLADDNAVTSLDEIEEEILVETSEDLDDEEYQELADSPQLVAKAEKSRVLIRLDEIIRNLKILIDNNQDSKLPNLLKAIKFGFAKMKEIGAREKCVIFTESVATQKYLKQYLEQNGFADKIVLFNASNNDDKSKQIYHDWLNVKANRKKISGVKSADMKLAITEYFEKTAKILIATDSASEGVNLQFCSLLINYDLPWNPQRIEQRIGRVHRYGQKYDVVVVNFVDTNNMIDKRIYEILDKKFGLFDGVFGASNEILGSIANLNNGFEQAIQNIFTRCRDEESINQEFDLLGEQFKEENNQRLQKAKQILETYFDEDVHNLLQQSEEQSKNRLDQISQKFWELTKYQLPQLAPKVEFDEDDKTIELNQQIQGIRSAIYYMIKKDNWEEQQDYTNNQLYRLNHPLGELVINFAKAQTTPNALLEFDLSNYGKQVNALDAYKNQSGTLALEHLVIKTNDHNEDYLVFSGKLDNGQELTQSECERLFNLVATVRNTDKIDNIEYLQKQNRDIALAKFEQQKAQNFDDVYLQIENFRNDILADFNSQIEEIDGQIKEINKSIKQAVNIRDKVSLTGEINLLKSKKRKMIDNRQMRELELDDEIAELVQQYQTQLEPNIKASNLFSIKFKVI
ncbi:SNF2-related protein [Aquella oligotrophica]|uniref:ATP-dependent helicase n=1 Tax=Aquella oligotrophica TaxID=2067065 RepID=A0A2I7N4Z4_9NEIS|nr:SNF2-related protein [Aquella oligotrophica]AUR51536.1 ATP-dependent helicase [Aquella oligotrophica]